MSSIYVARQPIFELGRGLYGYELLYRRGADADRAEGDSQFHERRCDRERPARHRIAYDRRQRRGVRELFARPAPQRELGAVRAKVGRDRASRERRMRRRNNCRVYQDGQRGLQARARRLCVQRAVEAPARAGVGHQDRHSESVARRPRARRRSAPPSGARLLAERVETAAVRDMCADLGYELFQGYLFSRPETLTKTDVSAGQLAIMRLLNLIRDARASDRSLETAFQTDLALTYKLLRIVNAAAIGGRGITSIPHAMRLIGRDALHRWLTVLLVASVGRRGDVNHELALTAMTRARRCANSSRCASMRRSRRRVRVHRRPAVAPRRAARDADGCRSSRSWSSAGTSATRC